LAKSKNINGISCKRYGLEELLNETKECSLISKNSFIIVNEYKNEFNII